MITILLVVLGFLLLPVLFLLLSLAVNLVLHFAAMIFLYGWLGLIGLGVALMWSGYVFGAYLVFFGLLWFAAMISRGWFNG